jgi:hypothetical protein
VAQGRAPHERETTRLHPPQRAAGGGAAGGEGGSAAKRPREGATGAAAAAAAAQAGDAAAGAAAAAEGEKAPQSRYPLPGEARGAALSEQAKDRLLDPSRLPGSPARQRGKKPNKQRLGDVQSAADTLLNRFLNGAGAAAPLPRSAESATDIFQWYASKRGAYFQSQKDEREGDPYCDLEFQRCEKTAFLARLNAERKQRFLAIGCDETGAPFPAKEKGEEEEESE